MTSAATTDASGRPTRELPLRQLVQMSLYWFGLSSILAGLTAIMGGRLEFTHLVGPGEAGRPLSPTRIGGAAIVVTSNPTIGWISDYTTSRWGRRKPYILIGSLLDVVFLI